MARPLCLTLSAYEAECRAYIDGWAELAAVFARLPRETVVKYYTL